MTTTPRQPKRRVHRGDQEFLPADLEILEKPPSPTGLALIVIICALVVTAVTWSWIGRIDIIAVAQGKIQPTGRVKVIQPLEPGKITTIRVENGRRVRAGDVLFELDDRDARAEETDAHDNWAAYRAEAARRQVAVDAARTRHLSGVTPPPSDPDISEAIRSREADVLAGDLDRLAAAAADVDAQMRQKEVERDRLQGTIEAQKRLLGVLQQRVDMRSSLVQSGSGAKSALIDAEETLEYHRTQLAMQQGQHDSAIASLDVLARQRDRAFSDFLADQAQRRAEAHRQAADWFEKLQKARLKVARTVLASPIDGVVYGLSVTTIGQVVGAGEELARVVPDGAELEIEGYLANRDVGFVHPGQTAVVKIESFPFTRYGTLTATVIRVGGDAIPEPDAARVESNAARSPREKTIAGGERTQNLVYPVTLAPSRKTMTADGFDTPLIAGMATTVEITTGNRRILEYLFSPLVETASQAMNER